MRNPQRDFDRGTFQAIFPRLIVTELVKCWYRAHCTVCYGVHTNKNHIAISDPRWNWEIVRTSHSFLPTSQWTRINLTCEGCYLRPLCYIIYTSWYAILELHELYSHTLDYRLVENG